MKRIHYNSKDCTGCTACYSVCPTKSIQMVVDHEGFNVPYIDDEKCINCLKCEKVCPVNYKVIQQNDCEVKAYAFQNSDKNILSKSSSGAFFPALAEYVLSFDGYICGCVLDNNLTPKHIVSNNRLDIYKMQDSKYVQSDLGNCYNDIILLLENRKKVLFTGTSCQVAGLKSLIKAKKINDENLICVDFFCHGVPSPKVWSSYLDFYRKEKKTKILKYRFRNKKYGWGKASRGTYHLNTVYKSNGKKDDISLAARMWYFIFFSNLCLRRYCYRCPYTSLDKPSDFTMADFWGIENISNEFLDGSGCSLVLCHNAKTKAIIDELAKKSKIVSVNTVEAIKKQGNAFGPSAEPDIRDEFWSDFDSKDFNFVAKKYFRYDCVHKIKDFIHRFMFELHFTNLYK